MISTDIYLPQELFFHQILIYASDLDILRWKDISKWNFEEYVRRIPQLSCLPESYLIAVQNDDLPLLISLDHYPSIIVSPLFWRKLIDISIDKSSWEIIDQLLSKRRINNRCKMSESMQVSHLRLSCRNSKYLPKINDIVRMKDSIYHRRQIFREYLRCYPHDLKYLLQLTLSFPRALQDEIDSILG